MDLACKCMCRCVGVCGFDGGICVYVLNDMKETNPIFRSVIKQVPSQ